MNSFIHDIDMVLDAARPDTSPAPVHYSIASDADSACSDVSDCSATAWSASASPSSTGIQTDLNSTNTIVTFDIDSQVSATFQNACNTFAASMQARLADLEVLAIDALPARDDAPIDPRLLHADFVVSLDASLRVVDLADSVNASCRKNMAHFSSFGTSSATTSALGGSSTSTTPGSRTTRSSRRSLSWAPCALSRAARGSCLESRSPNVWHLRSCTALATDLRSLLKPLRRLPCWASRLPSTRCTSSTTCSRASSATFQWADSLLGACRPAACRLHARPWLAC